MFTDTINPRFSETDALGHINNNTYGIWFEAARDSIYKIFIPSLNAKKWNLIMAHSSYDFLAEVHYGKEVIIKTNPLFPLHDEYLSEFTKIDYSKDYNDQKMI